MMHTEGLQNWRKIVQGLKYFLSVFFISLLIIYFTVNKMPHSECVVCTKTIRSNKCPRPVKQNAVWTIFQKYVADFHPGLQYVRESHICAACHIKVKNHSKVIVPRPNHDPVLQYSSRILALESEPIESSVGHKEFILESEPTLALGNPEQELVYESEPSLDSSGF